MSIPLPPLPNFVLLAPATHRKTCSTARSMLLDVVPYTEEDYYELLHRRELLLQPCNSGTRLGARTALATEALEFEFLLSSSDEDEIEEDARRRKRSTSTRRPSAACNNPVREFYEELAARRYGFHAHKRYSAGYSDNDNLTAPRPSSSHSSSSSHDTLPYPSSPSARASPGSTGLTDMQAKQNAFRARQGESRGTLHDRLAAAVAVRDGTSRSPSRRVREVLRTEDERRHTRAASAARRRRQRGPDTLPPPSGFLRGWLLRRAGQRLEQGAGEFIGASWEELRAQSMSPHRAYSVRHPGPDAAARAGHGAGVVRHSLTDVLAEVRRAGGPLQPHQVAMEARRHAFWGAVGGSDAAGGGGGLVRTSLGIQLQDIRVLG